MKKIKQIKKVNRDTNLDDIRRHGDICKLPGNKVFKDRKKDARKYASRKPVDRDDY